MRTRSRRNSIKNLGFGGQALQETTTITDGINDNIDGIDIFNPDKSSKMVRVVSIVGKWYPIECSLILDQARDISKVVYLQL